MGDPTTVNPVASVVNSVLKKAIEDVGETAAESALIADFPWLGLPVVKQIFEYGLGIVGKYFYEQAAFAATKIIIDVQTKLEASSAQSAFENLRMAVASGDANAIQLASDDLDKAYANLIHYDGSASP